MLRNPYKAPKRMKAYSHKRLALQDAREACVKAVRKRAGGKCEMAVEGVCDRFAPLDVHERRLRSQGGDPTDPAGCLLACRACHDWAHEHRDEARRLGFILHREDVAG